MESQFGGNSLRIFNSWTDNRATNLEPNFVLILSAKTAAIVATTGQIPNYFVQFYYNFQIGMRPIRHSFVTNTLMLPQSVPRVQKGFVEKHKLRLVSKHLSLFIKKCLIQCCQFWRFCAKSATFEMSLAQDFFTGDWRYLGDFRLFQCKIQKMSFYC